VSFPELVWVHHLRQKQLAKGSVYEGEAEERYRRFRAAFEQRYGEIVSEYWASNAASGVALTIRPRPWIVPDHIRLHCATAWSTQDQPVLQALLHKTEALGVRVAEVLRDTSKRVAMQWLFSVSGRVLAFAESPAAGNAEETKAVVEEQTAELAAVEKYYKNSAGRSGQIVYLGGTLLGVLPLLALALIAALFGVLDAGSHEVRTAVACFAAGGVGAVVSVMSRMSGRVTGVDWEFGKDTLRTLGSLRPFVGAVFGLMTYFALKSGLVSLDLGDGRKTFYFYVLFSFVAGFSERLAQDMLLGSALQHVQRRPEPEPVPAAEPPAATPASQPAS
jgi:hypothetical protein